MTPVAPASQKALVSERPISGKTSSIERAKDLHNGRGNHVPFIEKPGKGVELLPGDAGRHEHEPEATVSHIIQQDSNCSPRRHTVSRSNYRAFDDTAAVNAR